MKTKIISFCLAVTLLLSFLTLTGCKNRSKEFVTLETCSEEQMLIYRAIYEETGFNPVVDASNYSAEEKVYTDVTVNFAYSVGFGRYLVLSLEEFEDIQRYQNETGKQVLYPIVNPKCHTTCPPSNSRRFPLRKGYGILRTPRNTPAKVCFPFGIHAFFPSLLPCRNKDMQGLV